MAITITIDGTDRTSRVDWQSLTLSQVLTKEPDQLRFLIRQFGTNNYRPNLGEEVILYRDATRLFGGVVVEIIEQVEGVAQYLDIVCKDYTEILDGQLVAKTYEQKSVAFIINDILTNFAFGLGFTNTNGNVPLIIDKIVFNYLPISKCLEKLSEYLINYDWYVDYLKDIWFFNTSVNPAPFNLTDTNGKYIWQSLEIKNEVHQVRNEMYVRGGEIRSVSKRKDLFDGDGTKVIFVLGNKFPEKPEVKVNGSSKNVGIDYQDLDGGFDCMWDFNRRTIRFTTGNTPPSGTNNIEVEGFPLYPLVFRKRDETSILAYGLKQQLIVDKTIATISAASQRCNKELQKFSTPAKIGSFRTYSDGLHPGQTISINSAIRGINSNFKITGIRSVLHSHDTFEHSVSILASEDIGINDVLTDLLVKGPAEELDSNYEFIQRYLEFNESFTSTDDLEQPTVRTGPYKWAPSDNDLVWSFGTWS
jgi:hypothetical protein